MTSRPTLTLAFLTHAPASAAEVLERLEPASAAAFLDDVPARLAASVLGLMTPWSGARVLGSLAPEQAAAVLRLLPFHDGVALLRLVPPERQAPLFEELPARRAQRLKNALKYSPGSVGAWLDPDVPAFPAATQVAEALRYLRHSEEDTHVFLQDDASGRFIGAVPVGRLLRADAATPLAELPIEKVMALSSRASLSSAATHPGWDRYLQLPVLGRGDAMVGALSRQSLRRGLNEHVAASKGETGSMLAEVIAAFGVACSGMLQAMGGSARSPGSEGDERG